MDNSPKTYSYVVLVNGQPLYSGKNVEQLYKKAKKKHPGQRIAVKWEPPEGILIAVDQQDFLRQFDEKRTVISW